MWECVSKMSRVSSPFNGESPVSCKEIVGPRLVIIMHDTVTRKDCMGNRPQCLWGGGKKQKWKIQHSAVNRKIIYKKCCWIFFPNSNLRTASFCRICAQSSFFSEMKWQRRVSLWLIWFKLSSYRGQSTEPVFGSRIANCHWKAFVILVNKKLFALHLLYIIVLATKNLFKHHKMHRSWSCVLQHS